LCIILAVSLLIIKDHNLWTVFLVGCVILVLALVTAASFVIVTRRWLRCVRVLVYYRKSVCLSSV